MTNCNVLSVNALYEWSVTRINYCVHFMSLSNKYSCMSKGIEMSIWRADRLIY